MRHWNYRLVLTSQDPEERQLTICEVYYDRAGTPRSYVERTVAATDALPGGMREQLEDVLAKMREAMGKTILMVEDRKLIDTNQMLP